LDEVAEARVSIAAHVGGQGLCLEAFVGRPPAWLFAAVLGVLCGPMVDDLEAGH